MKMPKIASIQNSLRVDARYQSSQPCICPPRFSSPSFPAECIYTLLQVSDVLRVKLAFRALDMFHCRGCVIGYLWRISNTSSAPRQSSCFSIDTPHSTSLLCHYLLSYYRLIRRSWSPPSNKPRKQRTILNQRAPLGYLGTLQQLYQAASSTIRHCKFSTRCL